ncbi:MAG: YihY/virulence factor BrkB family protein [Chloroflexi bacterium]|nr:YihY/virulence factor BrkB family protein [Chloroflexota bacterium]
MPTSLLAALVFELVKCIFILYLHHGAERFLTIYGSISTLMILFVFFYAQTHILLLGALLSSKWVAYLEGRRGRVAR